MPPVNDQPRLETVLRQLERVLQSDLFSRSERSSAILRYIVTEALNGRGGQLKESVLAAEVFRRGETYDPQVDAAVRVEVSRLRTKLREYYTRADAGDLVLIEIPRG